MPFLLMMCCCWKATLQPIVTLFTIKTKYITVTKLIKEAIWLKELLGKLSYDEDMIVINCDNWSAIHLSIDKMFHERTKHINVRYILFEMLFQLMILL